MNDYSVGGCTNALAAILYTFVTQTAPTH